MAKITFEFTDSDEVSGDKPGKLTIPVNIHINIEGLSDERPGHSDCLALIMKQKAGAILKVINEMYIRELTKSGNYVSSEILNVYTQQGDKNVH